MATALVATIVVPAVSASAEPGFGGPIPLATDVGAPVAGADPFVSLSCPTPGVCTAVGPDEPSGDGGAPSAVSRVNGAWGDASAISLPTDADENAQESGAELTGVSCWAEGACAAVGDYNYPYPVTLAGLTSEIPLAEPMAAVEVGGVWTTATAITLPTVSSAYVSGRLTSVACDRDGNCTAAGDYYVEPFTDAFTNTYTPFVTTEMGGTGTWSAIVALPTVPGKPGNIEPTSVSCPDQLDCVVSEFVADSVAKVPRYSSYVVTDSSGTWGPPRALSGVGGRPVHVTSLSCPAVGSCVAVGSSSPNDYAIQNSTGMLPAVAVEHDGAWAPTRDLPLPMLSPVVNEAQLDAVSCATATTCEAVGDGVVARADVTEVPAAASWVNGRWSSLGLDHDAISFGSTPATTSRFLGVACVLVASCVALQTATTGTLASPNFEYSEISNVSVVASVRLPAAPRVLSARQRGGQLRVTYVPPTSDGGSAITYFVVSAGTRGRPDLRCTSTTSTCIYKNVRRPGRYRLSVRARNAAGLSPPSATLTVNVT